MTSPTSSLTTVPVTVPLALLPVRLETRYQAGPPPAGGTTPTWTLLVRVFPDQVHRDAHQEALTHDEVAARAEFSAEGGYGSDPEAPAAAAAWARLVDRYGAGRAAWIVATGLPGGVNRTPRDAAWSDPTWATCLPDRWVVYGYRGSQQVVTASGGPIAGDLAVSPAPNEAPPPVPTPPPGCPPGGDPRVPGSIRWLVDPVAAESAGMLIRVPLGTEPHLDRLLVFGVRGETGTAGANRLAGLLAAHHYTDGLALVAQGTATNNTAAGPSALSTVDTGSAASRVRERGLVKCAAGDGSDGARLAAALGVPATAFARADGAEARESLDAQAMNAALWPATWGYVLSRLSTATDPEPYRRHFVDWVRARGPLGTLRVGRQPYGVLPVTSLARFQAPAGSPELTMADLVRRARNLWSNAAGAFGPGSQKIRDILKRRPVSDGYAARGVFSAEWLPSSLSFMGLTHASAQQRRDMAGMQLGSQTAYVGGTPAWFPPLADILTLPQAWPGIVPTIQASGDPALAAAWVSALLDRLVATLPNDPEAGTWSARPPDSLLYLLLRHAARLVGTVATGQVPATTPRGSFGDRPDPAGQAALPELIGALTYLKARPAGVLDRLTRETLDLANNRPDAWATSLATRRLAGLRVAGSTGVVVGGYGWLEKLDPRTGDTPVTQTPPCEQPGLVLRAGNAGYLHAPSPAQATTAAVLRSAHLTHVGETTPTGTTPFAIDLSSHRVRLAQALLAGLRNGQTLGTLLGYRFERALRDLSPAAAASIPYFRPLAPASTATSAGRRADDVVDGVALLKLYTAGSIPWGQNGIPAQSVVSPAFAVLRDALDALADTTVAESVHQTLQGNHARASAALAVGQVDGVVPDELEFPRTPRPGSTLTHRLLILLDAPPLDPDATTGWRVGPRERAEPALAAWLARLLGSPTRVKAHVELRDPRSGEPLGPVQPVTLNDLAPRPLDLLAYAASPADLDRRLGLHLLAQPNAPVAATAHLLPDPASPLAATEVYLGDLMEVVRAVASVLSAGRPADARDLATGAVDPGIETGLSARVGTAHTGLGQVATELGTALGPAPGVANPTDVRAGLLAAASYGVSGALPDATTATDVDTLAALRRQAEAVIAEIARRRSTVDTTDPVGALRTLFGAGFTVVPRFTAAVGRAFTGTSVTPAAAGQDPLSWFAKTARVRAAVGSAEALASYGQALGTGRGLALTVGQVPAAESGTTRWYGLPPANPTDRIPAEAVSLLVLGPAPATTGTLAALLVDEWREVRPGRRQTTALAYHYDAPGSQAPQAILVAVSPRTDAGNWTVDDLAATLGETLDMARGRAIDRDDLGNDTPLNGLLYLPNEVPAQTVTVPVGRLVAQPAGYGVPEPAPPPVVNPLPPNRPDGTTAVRQGKSVTLTVAGQHLYGQVWSASAGLTVTVSNASETGVTLSVTATPEAPLGAGTLTVRAWGGEASRSITVLPRPTLTAFSVSPTPVEQLETTRVYTVTLTGQQLLNATAAVAGQSAAQATVTASTPTSLTVRLTIAGSPKPPVVWDPTEPGGPIHPPRWVSFRYDIGITLTVTIARESDQTPAEAVMTNVASGLPLIMSGLAWEQVES